MLHVIALAATPAAFAWSTLWALVLSRLITAACRAAAAAPRLAAYCTRSGLTGYAAIRRFPIEYAR